MNRTFQITKYVFCDFLAAVLSWCGLFLFRKVYVEGLPTDQLATVFNDGNFWWGVMLVPVCWIALYVIQGTYRNVFRKARLKEFQQTVVATTIGSVIIFFVLILDDKTSSYTSYYLSILVLFALQFCLTYFPRLIITSRMVHKVHSRKIGFKTLLVGSKENAYRIFRDIENQEISSGNFFIGYVMVNGRTDDRLQKELPYLGNADKIAEIIANRGVEEVIIAVEQDEHHKIQSIINQLTRKGLVIKITPDTRDIIVGSVKMSSIFHSPLIVINPRLMEEWQYSVKRIFDILVSLLAMIILSPVYLITAIIVKMTSKGSVFYAQERVGLHGKPFKMIKFRSMYTNAEASGPMLSKDNDPRITPFGRFMRKVRLDEIPQFYNVLKGTMSLVGPRPERQFFINQIVQKAPEYLMLQKVKPGITSWGQVKYGYAENVDEMVERLRYDLLYLENMSITTDIKILLYTAIIIVQGRGK